MFCLALWIGKCSLRTLEGADRAPKSGQRDARKGTEKGPRVFEKATRGAPRPRPWAKTGPKGPFAPHRGLQRVRSGPQEGPKEPQEAQDTVQDGPQGAPDEVQKSVGRASGTSRDEKAKIVLSHRRERDFRGPDGPERGPKSAQFGPNVGPEGQSERRLDPNSRRVGRQARNPAQDGRRPPGRGVGTHREPLQIRGQDPFIRPVMC